jgi:hypothetical protein
LQNLIKSKLKQGVIISFSLRVIAAVIQSDMQMVYSQPMTGMTSNTTQNTSQKHVVHTIDNLVISEHIPLTGQLVAGDYLLLMDFTPFSTSVEGHSHIALKVPCSDDGTPKITIATGVAPKLNTLNMGNAIINGTLDGGKLNLSVEGRSCLFHSDLPIGVTDVVLINTSNETLDFDSSGYSVTISIHGTAIQHSGISMP